MIKQFENLIYTRMEANDPIFQKSTIKQVQTLYLPVFNNLLNDLDIAEVNLIQQTINNFKEYCAIKFRYYNDTLQLDITNPDKLSKKDRKIYLSCPFHTAYRYFSFPNPLGQDPEQDNGMRLPRKIQKVMCLFWMAVSDPKNKLGKGVTRKSVKDLFVREIALMCRSNSRDITNNDRTYCQAGILECLDQICLDLLIEEFGSQPTLGENLLNEIKGIGYKVAEKVFIKSLATNKNISSNELKSMLIAFIKKTTWPMNEDPCNIDVFETIISKWIKSSKEDGVINFEDNTQIIKLSNEKIDFFGKILLDIFTELTNSLIDLDERYKNIDLTLKNKEYDKDFSTPMYRKIIALYLDHGLDKKYLHNYANFFKVQVLNNYCNIFEIMTTGLRRGINNEGSGKLNVLEKPINYRTISNFFCYANDRTNVITFNKDNEKNISLIPEECVDHINSFIDPMVKRKAMRQTNFSMVKRKAMKQTNFYK